MSLCVQKIIWVVGVVGLSCLACERSLPPNTFACQSSTQFQSVLTQIRQQSQQPELLQQQPELLQQLEDCAHNNPQRLKAIVSTFTGPMLIEVLAASPQLVESFAAIPPNSLGEATQPFLFASFHATNSAKDSQTFQTQLLGYLGAVDIVELVDIFYWNWSFGGDQFVDRLAIAFQQSPQAKNNPLPAIYTQLSQETLAFRQGTTLDRVNAFVQHPKQQKLCGYLAQYLIRGWQKANLSDQAKADHLKLATSHLMKSGAFPSNQQPGETIPISQLTSQLIQEERGKMGRGYRKLLLLATHPLGEDFTKDRIPDLVRTGNKAFSEEQSKQLSKNYHECICSYRNVQ